MNTDEKISNFIIYKYKKLDKETISQNIMKVGVVEKEK